MNAHTVDTNSIPGIPFGVRRAALIVVGLAAIFAAGCLSDSVPASGPSVCLDNDHPALASALKEIAPYFQSTRPFPFDFDLIDVAGEPIRKSDFAGKVLIVDIWGTWCPPCQKEIPHFIALYQRYRDQGLEIVGLNSERGSPEAAAQTVRSYRKEAGIPYRCAINTPEIEDQVPSFDGYPTTLFFDRSGKLRLKLVGLHDMRVLQAAVETLLREEA